MKTMMTVLIAGAVLMTSALGFAREGGGRDFNSRPRTDWKPEIVKYEGIVRCKNACKDSASTCDMEFVRNDGETFGLEDSQALATLHCQNHRRDLKVTLEAEKTPRFLFWGGNLVTKSFNVIAEIPSKTCLAQRGEQLSQYPASPREPVFRRRASL